MALALLTLCNASIFLNAQTREPIEIAKAELESLHKQLTQLESDLNLQILQDVAKQVNTGPKDEFETTKQYAARLARIKSVRSQVEARYAPDRSRRRKEIQQKIDAIYDSEFDGPVEVRLDPYDADAGYFNLFVKDVYNEGHSEIVPVPNAEARKFKEEFRSAELKGVYGVMLDEGVAKDYYFGLRIKLNGNSYSTLPPPMQPSNQDLQGYRKLSSEAAVLHLRKTIDKYLKDRSTVSEEERDALDTIDRTYLDSKFIVYWYGPFLLGGKWIKVIFVNRPDRVFIFWVYRILEVRSVQAEELTQREMRRIRLVYRSAFKDSKLHL